ncbi:hypothetical protein DITRI_Ditri05aG0044600 [Diplodiscus trichospermus]
MENYGICWFFIRRFKFTEAVPPPDVIDAFNKYADGGPHMTAEQLLSFLKDVQGQGGAKLEDAEGIVQQVMQKRHHLAKFRRHALTLDDFHHYLCSADLNPPINNEVHHDMTAPLSHYFIYTGHNSYLTGNQLTSRCSHVPIEEALKRGVRVVELDLWPNSRKDGVIVKHGGTWTKPVKLIECLQSIKEHAFKASPYPVVITLEDHLTPDLQEQVAQMVDQTFGKMLFRPEFECLKAPEDLRNRIIISTKPPEKYLGKKPTELSANKKDEKMVTRIFKKMLFCTEHECLKAPEDLISTKSPKEYLEAQSNRDSNSHKRKDSDDDVWGEEPTELSADQEDEKTDSETSDNNQDGEDADEYEPELRPSEAPLYKHLIAIHAGKPKGGLKEALKVELDKVRRLSLSELQLKKATNSHRTDVVRFTRKNFLRVYPKGTRIDSSNYNPLIGWMHGAQMVAFNMQGYGRCLWLMHGMFRSNGGCGYVKKPDFLMNEDPNGRVFDPKPKAKLPVKKTLKVKVYMGDGWRLDFKKTHFDSYSPPDFYTRVGIAGVPADVKMEKTKVISNNWTPVWDEEFEFRLTVPELALLRVEVHEYDSSEKDDFGGQTCLPVSELKPGIRAVALFDEKGNKLNSVRLLMRFEFV